MDFTLNEEQIAIRQTCREFAEQEIKPVAENSMLPGRSLMRSFVRWVN